MTSQEIRAAFFDYFQTKDHRIVSSAPIVVKDDPSLLFTNAGMNQFKEYFLGNLNAEHSRVADTQKCLRVSGKHNDLEEVGVDTYHHTMFEMLGNWSFGDFFKEEMIPWAWEFLTEHMGLEKDRMYVTVFQGDEKEGLAEDDESYRIWSKVVEEDRILKANKADNFWEMGETGPCGPSSEIHIDLRSDEERQEKSGKSLVNKDHPLVVEIWNLVFIEFNRLKNRSLEKLPAKHVDTGMGLERLCMAVQNKQSNYDTDLFMPSIEKLETIAGVKYGSGDESIDTAIRVIVDHVRAVAFSIADGQLPTNTGAGYVIRRILRRAIRYGYSFLNLKQPFIYQLLEVLIETLGKTFPELGKQKDLIEKVMKEEEQSFLMTLDRGIIRFEEYAKMEKQSVDGAFAFELYDTFGFPLDLTVLLAREKNMNVDIEGFDSNLGEQKDRSRAAASVDAGDWVEVFKDDKEEFIGYDRTETKVKISRYREVKSKGKKSYHLVFNFTPFYPEGGGQVGDQGYIEAKGKKFRIVDTKKENNLIIHSSEELPEDLESEFNAVVDSNKRRQTTANHSATHLLHHALREVLGKHVEQKGSLVNPEHLRFDFSHFQKVGNEELRQIENLVNGQIRKNVILNESRDVPMAEAKEMGAMALFGEKYGDVVRVIQFGESVELCGGTHVQATGEIGLFKIVSESAIAAGIRRIEAISSEGAQELFFEQSDLIHDLKQRLKNPKQLSQAINDLLKDNQRLQKELDQQKQKAAGNIKQDLLEKIEDQGEFKLLIEEVALDAASIKNIAFQLKSEVKNLFLLIVSKAGDKPSITISIDEELAKVKSWNAGSMVRDLAKYIQGGGGGQAFFASAGGKDPNGLSEVLKAAREMISK